MNEGSLSSFKTLFRHLYVDIYPIKTRLYYKFTRKYTCEYNIYIRVSTINIFYLD